MRHYITFLSFILLFLTYNSILAQSEKKNNSLSSIDIEENIYNNAKKRCQELSTIVNLSEAQENDVLEIFLLVENRKSKIINPNLNPKTDKILMEINSFENNKLSVILDENQFKKYKELLNKGQ